MALKQSVCSSFLFFLVFLLAGSSPAESPPEPQPAPVMLAETWQPHLNTDGWWMSEKLDGIRGYWTGSQFISRSGNELTVPAWFTENFPAVPLDGELWTGRGQFSDIVSIVRRQTPDERWKNVRYMIFDAPQADGDFEQRLDFARQWFAEHPNPGVSIIEQEVCLNAEHLQKKLADIEAAGGEGLILRKPQSAYTIGRSADILKVKTFQEADAIVIGHLPGSGRNAGRMGAIRVELPNRIQFAIGSGFSDAERENPPPIGSTVRFKHQGFTQAGVPRFASFVRIRERF